MPITEPSGTAVFSPKIRDQSLVRKFIGQNSVGYTALSIYSGNTLVDADANSINLSIYFDDVTAQFPAVPPGTLIASVGPTAISHDGTGLYHYDIGPANTANRGTLTMVWTYTINGVAFTYTDFAQVLNQMPFYESLSDQEKSVIEQVTWMLGDVFDSTEGGPFLIEPFQTHWDYERLAFMEQLAVTRFNMMSTFANAPTTYGIGPGAHQPFPAQYAGVLAIGTYLEVVRHLIRSYTEIPAFQNTNITFADRRDYAQRWATIYASDWPEYKQMVRNIKVSMLDLARGAILGAGGFYGGNATGIFIAGGYAAMVRGFRFYPAAPSVGWGAVSHGSGFPGGL